MTICCAVMKCKARSQWYRHGASQPVAYNTQQGYSKSLCSGREARRRQLAVGAVDFAQKIAKLQVVLFAGMGFDPGSDVNGVRLSDANGVENIGMGKTTRENNTKIGRASCRERV